MAVQVSGQISDPLEDPGSYLTPFNKSLFFSHSRMDFVCLFAIKNLNHCTGVTCFLMQLRVMEHNFLSSIAEVVLISQASICPFLGK